MRDVRENKIPSVNIFSSLPVKKKNVPFVNLKKCPLKFWTARENFVKCVREIEYVPVVNNAKSCLKHTFGFSRGRIIALILSRLVILRAFNQGGGV